MTVDPVRKAARARVAEHRQRLRLQGLRPVQVWIPDTRSESFLKAAHQQSAAASTSPYATEDQAFIDSINLIDTP